MDHATEPIKINTHESTNYIVITQTYAVTQNFNEKAGSMRLAWRKDPFKSTEERQGRGKEERIWERREGRRGKRDRTLHGTVGRRGRGVGKWEQGGVR